MDQWFDGDSAVSICLVARNDDLAVLRLSLDEQGKVTKYIEEDKNSVSEVLTEFIPAYSSAATGQFPADARFSTICR